MFSLLAISIKAPAISFSKLITCVASALAAPPKLNKVVISPIAPVSFDTCSIASS